MTDCHDKNEQTVIFHTVDDAVVADAESQVASLCSLERLTPCRRGFSASKSIAERIRSQRSRGSD